MSCTMTIHSVFTWSYSLPSWRYSSTIAPMQTCTAPNSQLFMLFFSPHPHILLTHAHSCICSTCVRLRLSLNKRVVAVALQPARWEHHIGEACRVSAATQRRALSHVFALRACPRLARGCGRVYPPRLCVYLFTRAVRFQRGGGGGVY